MLFEISAPLAPRVLGPHFAVAPAANPAFPAFPARGASPTLGTRRLPGRPSGAGNLSLRDSAAMARSQELARLFQQPDSPAQRRYEICRAYFHERTPADELAQRFHLHVGTVRAIVRDFARNPDVHTFFPTAQPGRKTSPKREAILDRARALRRQGFTLAEIQSTLDQEGHTVSQSYLFRVLQRAGLATTRHRRPQPQPGERANDGSVVPDSADVRELSLEDGRQFPTKVAGLFLFLPLVLDLDLPQAVTHAGLPGSEPIPPLQALLALLVPKLLGKRRVSHISDLCQDEGAGLFAGLNSVAQGHLRDRLLLQDRTDHDREIGRRFDRQDPVGRPSPELQPRLPRHPLSRRRARPGEPLGPDAEPGRTRRDGVRGASGRPAGALLRDGQRPPCRGRRPGS